MADDSERVSDSKLFQDSNYPAVSPFRVVTTWTLLTALSAFACSDNTQEQPRFDYAIVTSPNHSCALREAGLYCWGSNLAGELGDGTLAESDQPVAASAAGADIVELAATTGRTCARRSTGEVACWGSNDQGQLGIGTRENSLTATAALGIHDAVQMAVDSGSMCVLHSRGEVSCWGGAPKDSTANESLSPQRIPDLSGVVELRSGAMGSYCGRGTDGWIRCWSVREGQWTTPSDKLPALAGARAMVMLAWNEICAIVPEGNIQCHNIDSGRTAPLKHSDAAVKMTAGEGGLGVCASNVSGIWQCWNILPPDLDAVGPEYPLLNPVEVRSNPSIDDFVLSGFRSCVMRKDHSVGCGNANDLVSFSDLPQAIELDDRVELPL